MKLTKNKLRVLHYPQVPCEPFFVDVKDEEQAYLIKETLVNQHLFLFDNNFIPDYANSICVVMWDEDEKEWTDYYNEFEDMDFDDFKDAYSDYINGNN